MYNHKAHSSFVLPPQFTRNLIPEMHRTLHNLFAKCAKRFQTNHKLSCSMRIYASILACRLRPVISICLRVPPWSATHTLRAGILPAALLLPSVFIFASHCACLSFQACFGSRRRMVRASICRHPSMPRLRAYTKLCIHRHYAPHDALADAPTEHPEHHIARFPQNLSLCVPRRVCSCAT